MIDRQFYYLDQLIDLLIREHNKQIEKWGIQDHDASWWLTFTAEELGELSAAIAEHHFRGGQKSHVVQEAIQVATLALKIAEMYLDE